MKLYLAKIGWYIFPVFLIILSIVFLVLIYRRTTKTNKISNVDIKRVLKAFYFFLIATFLAIGVSAYRADSKLTIRPKIANIEQTQLQIAETKKRNEEISDELESALSVASEERQSLMNQENTDSKLITQEWLDIYRNKIDELQDEELRAEYSSRFDDVEEYFFP